MAGVMEKKVITRSISLPVQDCLSAPWREFEQQVCGAWDLSTSLANWAAHTLRAHDVVRTPGMTELPPLRAVDLYGLAFGRAREGEGRQRFACPSCRRTFAPSQLDAGAVPPHPRGKAACPGGGAVSLARKVLPALEAAYPDAGRWGGGKIAAASVLRKVDRDYRLYRGKIVWQQMRRTPEYLYPYPFPVHQQQWVPILSGNGLLAIAAGLPGGRVTLRLRGGPEFAHAVEVLKRIEAGELKQLELKIDAQSSHAHCRLVRDRRGDDAVRELRLMVRIAYQMEVYQSAAAKAALVRTGHDPLLSMVVAGEDRPFVLHAPWVRTWIDEHRRFLERFADDLKFEKRWPRRARKRRNRRQSRGADKQHNRLRSFRQEAAHQFVSHAARRGCGVIEYDDSDRSFAEEFPWHLMAQQFRDKCDELGLAFREVSSGAAVNGTAAVAAREE